MRERERESERDESDDRVYDILCWNIQCIYLFSTCSRKKKIEESKINLSIVTVIIVPKDLSNENQRSLPASIATLSLF